MVNNIELLSFKTFVLMPFGNNNEYQSGNEESEYVYTEIIKPGVKLAMGDEKDEPNIIREVDRNRPGSINAAIVEDLLKSDVVIVDVTGRNPNVFLELGIRYALRNKITIVITQEGTAVPFDIQGYRYIEYNRFKPSEARCKIAQFIREGFKEETQSDSVVFDVFRDMSVTIPGITESYGPETTKDKGIMRWEEYMERISWICKLLEDPAKTGHFTPQALIGISNGGLVVADLVGRALFRGTPILSLWANRFIRTTQSAFWFFDNPYNCAVLRALKESVEKIHKDEPATILLVDDHLGTGNTAQQATSYLREQLGNQTNILFIPLVSRRHEYIKVVEEFFPYQYHSTSGRKIFTITKEEFISRLNTKASYFPYLLKEISSGA